MSRRRGAPNTTCDVCGVPIYVEPSRLRKMKSKACSWECRSKGKWRDHQKIPRHRLRGDENPNWKGGFTYSHGYRLIRLPDHPRANGRGYVREHIVVAEKKIGRPIRSDEVVHHINHIKNDNRPENLEVIPRRLHASNRHRANIEKNLKEHYLCGEDVGTSKLTVVQVLEIRLKYLRDSKTMVELASEYGVNTTNIGKILGLKSWRHA